jgi:hypothetical protein
MNCQIPFATYSYSHNLLLSFERFLSLSLSTFCSSKKESQEHEEMTRLTMSREELFKIMIQQTADIKKENNKVIDI